MSAGGVCGEEPCCNACSSPMCVCVFRGRVVAHIPGPFAGVCSGEMPSSLLPDGKAVFLLWVTKSGLAGASLHLGLQKSAA